MKMRALVAMVNFTYAGKNRKIGDLFQASEKDAGILIVLKRAQADPAPQDEPQEVMPDTEPVKLVCEAMDMPLEPARRRGRPRTVAPKAEE